MRTHKPRQTWLLLLLTVAALTGSAMTPTWLLPGLSFFEAETYECWATPVYCTATAVAETPKGGSCVTNVGSFSADVATYTSTGQLYDSDAVMCTPW